MESHANDKVEEKRSVYLLFYAMQKKVNYGVMLRSAVAFGVREIGMSFGKNGDVRTILSRDRKQFSSCCCC